MNLGYTTIRLLGRGGFAGGATTRPKRFSRREKTGHADLTDLSRRKLGDREVSILQEFWMPSIRSMKWRNPLSEMGFPFTTDCERLYMKTSIHADTNADLISHTQLAQSKLRHGRVSLPPSATPSNFYDDSSILPVNNFERAGAFEPDKNFSLFSESLGCHLMVLASPSKNKQPIQHQDFCFPKIVLPNASKPIFIWLTDDSPNVTDRRFLQE